jgi:hypothetical protein
MGAGHHHGQATIHSEIQHSSKLGGEQRVRTAVARMSPAFLISPAESLGGPLKSRTLAPLPLQRKRQAVAGQSTVVLQTEESNLLNARVGGLEGIVASGQKEEVTLNAAFSRHRNLQPQAGRGWGADHPPQGIAWAEGFT